MWWWLVANFGVCLWFLANIKWEELKSSLLQLINSYANDNSLNSYIYINRLLLSYNSQIYFGPLLYPNAKVSLCLKMQIKLNRCITCFLCVLCLTTLLMWRDNATINTKITHSFWSVKQHSWSVKHECFINTLVVKTCDITREYSYASGTTQAKIKQKS